MRQRLSAYHTENMSILVINAGSSSLKFGLFDADTLYTLATGLIDWRRSAAGGVGYSPSDFASMPDATRLARRMPTRRAAISFSERRKSC
jgi:acetate kinase